MHDFDYFDCPSCSRPLIHPKTRVGESVLCPSCRQEVVVPTIQTGVNGKILSKGEELSEEVFRLGFREELAAADHLIDEFESLFRRKELVGKQIDTIQSNAEICVKQIKLLRATSVHRVSNALTQPCIFTPPPKEDRRALWLSMGFALITVAAGIWILVLLRT